MKQLSSNLGLVFKQGEAELPLVPTGWPFCVQERGCCDIMWKRRAQFFLTSCLPIRFIVCERQELLHHQWCNMKDIVKDPQRSFEEILKIKPVNGFLSVFFSCCASSLVSAKIRFKFQRVIKLVLAWNVRSLAYFALCSAVACILPSMSFEL